MKTTNQAVQLMTKLHVLYALFVPLFIACTLPAAATQAGIANASEYPDAIRGLRGIRDVTWHSHAAKVCESSAAAHLSAPPALLRRATLRPPPPPHSFLWPRRCCAAA